ncbi:MAG TPA: prolyl oligopeptidase family serine peptidase [Armatimonadota bacterium]|nr:prolyl oligopeptidase family serine peptidase [Armatimonadota bacterium]
MNKLTLLHSNRGSSAARPAAPRLTPFQPVVLCLFVMVTAAVPARASGAQPVTRKAAVARTNAAARPAADPPSVTYPDPASALAIGPVGRGGRSGIHEDPVEAMIVAGTWKAPVAGETVSNGMENGGSAAGGTANAGSARAWTPISLGKDGWFQSRELRGGYAYVRIDAPRPAIALLEAAGDDMVYVNGIPRAGDTYASGWMRLPIALKQGANDLLFHCSRARLHVQLKAPDANALLNIDDATLPDIHIASPASRPERRTYPPAPSLSGKRSLSSVLRPPSSVREASVLRPPSSVREASVLRPPSSVLEASVVVINATNQPMGGLTLSAACRGEHGVKTPLPTIVPLGVRKVGFAIRPPRKLTGDICPVALTLTRHQNGRSMVMDRAKISLRIRQPGATYKVTFISDIDGSVQYYAVNPAHPVNGDLPAMALSLHGAGVEAIGQADAYESKSWINIVCPTNRRPYGFDWEDWGRIDAMEVLDHALATIPTDPQRVYLTGHSMGGHGVWQVGVTYPDRFAAIGPSAGWISFSSYVNRSGAASPTPMSDLLERARASSDTLTREHNYASYGIYILHGGTDDNVPVEEARTMAKILSGFQHDFIYHEQPGVGHWWDISPEPGADCVDWAPMFDFFGRHAIPRDDMVRDIDFTTANPGDSARDHWLTIGAQIHALEPSRAQIQFDPGLHQFEGTTTNVARLSFDLDTIPGPRPARSNTGAAPTLDVKLDGQELKAIPWPATESRIWLTRHADQWSVSSRPASTLKGPLRYGPFKAAFNHRFLFVYGTRGTAQENDWALAKARYDAETFWYRGNGSVDIIPDTAFNPAIDPDRSVILYGSSDTNAAWSALLKNSPVQVRRGKVQIGDRTISGPDMACLFVRPRPGSDRACVGIVSGTGIVGMRLTDRLLCFVSDVGYPDCIVIGADMLTRGMEGVRAAGFFGIDWGVPDGDFVWTEPHGLTP